MISDWVSTRNREALRIDVDVGNSKTREVDIRIDDISFCWMISIIDRLKRRKRNACGSRTCCLAILYYDSRCICETEERNRSGRRGRRTRRRSGKLCAGPDSQRRARPFSCSSPPAFDAPSRTGLLDIILERRIESNVGARDRRVSAVLALSNY